MPFINCMLTVCNSAWRLTETNNNSINSQHRQRTLCLSFVENRLESGAEIGLPHRYGVLEAESELKSVSTAASLRGTRPLSYGTDTVVSLYKEPIPRQDAPTYLDTSWGCTTVSARASRVHMTTLRPLSSNWSESGRSLAIGGHSGFPTAARSFSAPNSLRFSGASGRREPLTFPLLIGWGPRLQFCCLTGCPRRLGGEVYRSDWLRRGGRCDVPGGDWPTPGCSPALPESGS